MEKERVIVRDGEEARVEGRLKRFISFARESVKETERTVELSFSSESPVERWWGWETLDHAAKSVRLGRLNDGGAVLVDHGGDQIGVVEQAEIAADRKGRALLRFGKGQRAMEVFQDIVDGIRRNVSVSYIIHKMVMEKQEEDVQWFRVLDWEPLEISIVGVPADVSVGVGRSADPDQGQRVEVVSQRNAGGIKMDKTAEQIKAETDAAVKAQRDTASAIMAIGKQHGCLDLAGEAIERGASLEEFRKEVLDKKYKAEVVKTADPKIGLSDKEVKQFSFLRAINAQIQRDWSKAGFEKECSDAVSKTLKRDAHGCFVPYDVMGRGLMERDQVGPTQSDMILRLLTASLSRDLQKQVGSAGGYTIATDLLAANFIELLRNRMMVRRMGATILGGLVGDVAIPSQTGGATAYWVGESVDPTESQQTFGQLGLTPKTVGAFSDISRKLLMQSSIDVEGFVRSDLATILALAMDLAAINGKGSAGEPVGILQTTGIGDVAGGTNGLAPAWLHIIELETDVASANADVGTMGYLTNALVRGKLKQVQKATNLDFIWTDSPAEVGMGSLNGYRAGVSNQVPSNLTKGTAVGICSAILFGNFADLIIAEWGGLDLMVDPYTGGAQGTVRVRVLQDVDVALRHPASFSTMQDALTT